MAHFAKLNENNEVISVIVVTNEDCHNLPFPESEEVGIDFLTKWSGGYTNWKQTSYNGNFRGMFAGIGFRYIKSHDIFVPPDYVYFPEYDKYLPPKPFESWYMNTETWYWNPPFSPPDEEHIWVWDETTQSWIQQGTLL